MLKTEVINKLAALAKIKPEDLTSAIKDEKEVDVPIDDKLTVYSEEEVATLKTNTYNDGKKAGVEMEIKDIKEKMGLEFQGKSINGLLDAHAKKVLADAKIEPEKKVAELTEKLTALQTSVQDYEKKIADKDAEVQGVKINGELYKHIPAPGENGPALAPDEIIQLMKANGYEFKINEGKIVPYKEGKPLSDKLMNALPVADVVTGFLKEKKLVSEGATGGRGGKDFKPNPSAGKLSELKAQFKAEGKSELGVEFQQAVQAAVKANPEFEMAG